MIPFLVAGAILGSGLGGVQVADRVLMVRLSPPDRIGEFFGIYGLVGKGSQVVGLLLYGLIIFLFIDSFGNGAYQLAVLSLLVNDADRAVARLAGTRRLGRLGRCCSTARDGSDRPAGAPRAGRGTERAALSGSARSLGGFSSLHLACQIGEHPAAALVAPFLGLPDSE